MPTARRWFYRPGASSVRFIAPQVPVTPACGTPLRHHLRRRRRRSMAVNDLRHQGRVLISARTRP
jgi:hypothetical protein